MVEGSSAFFLHNINVALRGLISCKAATFTWKLVVRRRLTVVLRPTHSVLEVECNGHRVSALCRQEGAVPPPSLQLSACGRVLARSDSSRDGLRLRLSRTRLGDDCHSVSCTLAWQGTNLTQQLTRNLLHSNKHVSSAGEQQHLQHVITLIILCLASNRLKQ